MKNTQPIAATIFLHTPFLSLIFLFTLTLGTTSCAWLQEKFGTSVSPSVSLPTQPSFDMNRAYQWVIDQENLGPRFVGSPGHAKMREWLQKTAKPLSHNWVENSGEMTLFDKKVPVYNYMAQLWPSHKKRILFSAHYDTRPHADKEKDPVKKTLPLLGANDGASGVAVLIALLDSLSKIKDLPIGIDFMFWDTEDLGMSHDPNSFCLGSQMWAKNPVPTGYRPVVNINFDMVGRSGSIFPIERGSENSAKKFLDLFWAAAGKQGKGDFFSDERIGPIMDDHTILSDELGIPAIDIIYMTTGPKFPPEWHTLADTSDVISRDTLGAVGQTAIQFVWDAIGLNALD